MAHAIFNEAELTLKDGKKLTMRADVECILGIERDTRRGIFRLYRDFNSYDFSFGDVVSVIFNGLKSAEEGMSLEEVFKQASAMGIDNASAQALDFLTVSMTGQQLGKQKTPVKS